MTSNCTTTAYALGEGEGTAYWFAGALMVAKATAQCTGGSFALLDQLVPPNYAPPRHVHHGEDEAWYLLEGEVTFYCGDRTLAAGPGSFVFGPRGVEHTFKVGPRGARILTFAVPAAFADFVVAAGEAAPGGTEPPAAPLDPSRLTDIAARFGIEITGPSPR